MILLIDNYDSFTYNLYQYLEEIGAATTVLRNDAIDLQGIQEGIDTGRWAGIVVSPGPKAPQDAGISPHVITRYSGSLPILGVCLGHQSIVHAFGGEVVRAPAPVHGKASQIAHDGSRLFAGLPAQFAVGRYHSLVGQEHTLPACLRVTARSLDDDLIMALEHRTHPTFGVQFHPESILTEHGHAMLQNFVDVVRAARPSQAPPQSVELGGGR